MTGQIAIDFLRHDAAAVTRRAGKAAALRRLLADGAWHTATELEAVGGRRYGARLHEIRRGDDGRPAVEIEGQRRGGARGDCEWRYREEARKAAELDAGRDESPQGNLF